MFCQLVNKQKGINKLVKNKKIKLKLSKAKLYSMFKKDQTKLIYKKHNIKGKNLTVNIKKEKNKNIKL